MQITDRLLQLQADEEEEAGVVALGSGFSFVGFGV
jgi:hypothetical protein